MPAGAPPPYGVEHGRLLVSVPAGDPPTPPTTLHPDLPALARKETVSSTPVGCNSWVRVGSCRGRDNTPRTLHNLPQQPGMPAATGGCDAVLRCLFCIDAATYYHVPTAGTRTRTRFCCARPGLPAARVCRAHLHTKTNCRSPRAIPAPLCRSAAADCRGIRCSASAAVPVFQVTCDSRMWCCSPCDVALSRRAKPARCLPATLAEGVLPHLTR